MSGISPCPSASTFPFPESEPGDGVELRKMRPEHRIRTLSSSFSCPTSVLAAQGAEQLLLQHLMFRKSLPTFSQVMLELGVPSDSGVDDESCRILRDNEHCLLSATQNGVP